MIDLGAARVPEEFTRRVPLRFARENALCQTGPGTLVLGRPDRRWAADRVAWAFDRPMEVIQASEEEVRRLIDRAYHEEAKGIGEVAEEVGGAREAGEVVLAEDVLELDEKAPAVRLVHAILLQAIRQRASDVHLEPGEEGVRVRFRVDGVLYDRALLGREAHEGLASRVKVMGRMDIAERRLPQDGGVTIRVGERRIDLRIATLPSLHGERVVLRLLDKTTGLLSLEGLGFSPGDLGRVRKILGLSSGIVLVTGPTGSGKTTTLYAMLSALDAKALNILTLEDPIEYQLPGITQTQVNSKKGLTFARGLRSLVRQDPDIIMVGEIRDLETAEVAIQSSLTGHLVFSTLHTNDAPSSAARLLDLGVEPYLVASSVKAILAQRLARVICRSCRRERALEEARALGAAPEDLGFLESLGTRALAEGAGCEACFGTGYAGRTAVFEILGVTESVREGILRRASASEIKARALAEGFVTLRKDGLRHVASGRTTLAEVLSVTPGDGEEE